MDLQDRHPYLSLGNSESPPPRYMAPDPTAPPPTITNTKSTYIQNLQHRLQKETEERERYKKRYIALDKFVFSLEVGFITTEVGLATTSIAFPPAAVVGGPVCLGMTGISALLRAGSRTIAKKIEKHTKLELLAKTHLAIISDKIVQAVENDSISVDEFRKISAEFDIYEKLKQDIQSQYKGATIEDLTKEQEQFLIDKGFKQAQVEITKQLKSAKPPPN